MAQNIELMGATYSAVPSVQLPKSGGGLAAFDDTSDADAAAEDIAQGKTAYVNGNKVTGIVPERFSSDIATLTPTALGGGVSAAPGIYRSAAVKRDINLVASNVRYNKTVFGVAGTFTQITGSDAAGAADITNGKKAFVNGSQIIGTLVVPTLHIATATATSANSSTLVFTGLAAEPELFFVTIDLSYSNRRTTAVMYDGATVYNTKSSSIYDSMTVSYSDGTLTITGIAADFDQTHTYTLTYCYVA